MRIYQKRLKRRKLRQKINYFIWWLFALIGGLFILNWSIGIFQEAAAFYLEPVTISVFNSDKTVGAVVDETTVHAVPEAGVEAPKPLLPAQETIKGIADKYEVDWKLVYAICMIESNCNSDRIGDGGKSFGAFQIHLPSHPDITKEQATDFNWAAEWTIKHGLKYKNNPELFLKIHNGLYKDNGWYVARGMEVYKNL